MSSLSNDRDIESNNIELNYLDSVNVIRNPDSDNELATKKHIDNSVGEGTFVRFNQTLENYLKVSNGNDTYNPTK